MVRFSLAPAVVAQLPALPQALGELEAYLKGAPQVLAWEAYRIEAVGFQAVSEG